MEAPTRVRRSQPTFTLTTATGRWFRRGFRCRQLTSALPWGNWASLPMSSRNWDVSGNFDWGSVLLNLRDWTPNGAGAGELGGTCTVAPAAPSIADPFSLNVTASLQTIGDADLANANQQFAFMAFLPAGSYQISLHHKTSADAQTVPEPGSLGPAGTGRCADGSDRHAQEVDEGLSRRSSSARSKQTASLGRPFVFARAAARIQSKANETFAGGRRNVAE